MIHQKCKLVLGALAVLGQLSPALIAEAETPKDTLVIGFESKPKSSDPRILGTDANSQYVEELRFLPLIGFDENGGMRMVVAQSLSADGSGGWKVKIRKGIKCKNGHEIDAEDVVATYNAIMSSPKDFPPSPRKGAFEKVTSVKKTAADEVQFSLSGADAAFITNLVIGILPKEALVEAPEQLLGKGYESGPFVLEKSADDEWILAKNDSYAADLVKTSKPKLNKVVFKIITDNSTRYAALVKGDLDMVQNSLDPDKVVEIQKNRADKFNVITRTAMSTTFLAFNLKNATFQNAKVRQAVAKAINRDEILQYTLQGLGEKAESMFPAAFPFHEKDIAAVKYDPEGAKKLLDEAGLKDPDGNGPLPRTRVTLKVPTNKERIAVAKAIASQLKLVGIDMQIESLEFSLFSKQLAEGQIQAWIAPWTGYKDPDHLNFVFNSKQIPPIGGNRSFYANAKVDELLEKGKTEYNSEKRHGIYSQAQKILADDAPYVYLWYKLGNAVISKNVKGYKLYSDFRYLSLTEVSKN